MEENKKSSIDLGLASFITAILPFVGRMMFAMNRNKPEMGHMYHGYMVMIASAMAITAIILGAIVVYRAVVRKEKKGLGYAIAGICIGCFQLLVFFLATIYMIFKHMQH